MLASGIEAGSFRDPRGHVHLDGGRVFRTITRTGIDDFRKVEATGLLRRLVDAGQLVDFEEVDARTHGFDDPEVVALLEHPRLPFVSHPYEWGFQLLKRAALLQLELGLAALREGVTLTDATAYNIQFVGAEPRFIDHLAFRPYRDGEFWTAHRQFCEQYLNPLLLRSKLGVHHNAWYRGALEGITTTDLNRMLPLRKKMSWNVFTQVVLQAHFQNASLEKSARAAVSNTRGLPRPAFESLLVSLRDWIRTLEPLGAPETVWGDYAEKNSYSDRAAAQKRTFIESFAAAVRPRLIWDIGCNTGEYSEAALMGGAEYVVGFDADQTALDKAFARARDRRLAFLPLYLDAANPAPSQGWGEGERKGLSARADADALLALALVHHLAIGRNVPLAGVVDWLVSLAPEGIIEFVPKSDPMVKELLRLRDDIFPDYDFEHFEASVEERADIVRVESVADSDRQLVWYRRR
jgi:ribosomal protein L11 methylase PrmA